jgi:hypothetical protein
MRPRAIPQFVAEAVLVLASVALIGGCASATIDDAVPYAAQEAPASPARGAVDTGTYPNLNVRPAAAAEQLSPEKSASEIESLKAVQARHASPPASATTDPQLLRKLAATHADEALKKIAEQP